jgi:hypothetical protein
MNKCLGDAAYRIVERFDKSLKKGIRQNAADSFGFNEPNTVPASPKAGGSTG